jgi:hypothetical protein
VGTVNSLRCPAGWLLTLALLTSFCCHPPARADEMQREALIKAAIVYKLAKFVEWPGASFADAGSPLRLCMLGTTPLADALRAAEGRAVHGHPITVGQVDDPGRVDACHIVYIANDQQHRLPALLALFDGRPVLSISEIDGFADNGGVIGIVRRGTRLGFQVNLGSARRAGLLVSAPLLELAEVVGRDL